MIAMVLIRIEKMILTLLLIKKNININITFTEGVPIM